MPRAISSTLAGGSRRIRNRADRIDAYVARRLRVRRSLIGMTQEQLARRLGVTFQQVQKYEHGSNRIGAGRLRQVADALEVPITFFYEGLPAVGSAPAGPDAQAERELADREALELVRAYRRIADARVRRRMLELLRAMARSESAGSGGGDR